METFQVSLTLLKMKHFCILKFSKAPSFSFVCFSKFKMYLAVLISGCKVNQ